MVNQTDLINVERELSKRSLHDFTRMGWNQVESRPFVDNWHLGAMSEHLQGVSSGQIRNLLINIPPRHMKSLSCNVFWPSWDWIANAWRTFMFVSYRTGLSERDNVRARKLVGSDWYQQRFSNEVRKTPDTASRWGLATGAERLITSVDGGSQTGEGGDIIVVDDPISADGARSDKQRQNVIDWWDDTIKSRFNDPKTGAFVVIMQRFHQNDLSGHILANEAGFDHLCIPARFERKHIYPIKSSLGFKDPRTKEGELLNPKRFGEAELNKLARRGTFQDAGQLQQRPVPRGGGLFKVSKLKVVQAVPAGTVWVRGWDLAASKKSTSAWTAGCLMGKTPNGMYIIADMIRERGSSGEVETLISNTAGQDDAIYGDVYGSIPQDPGAGGLAWATALVKACAGHNYHASTESGDKETRAEPFAAQVDIGNVMLLAGKWIKTFTEELEVFPMSKYKDQTDAASRAFAELVNAKTFKWYVSGDDD